MSTTNPFARPADTAGSLRQTLDHTMDRVGDSLEHLGSQAVPAAERVSAEAAALARRGIDAVRENSRRLRDEAARVSDHTVAYVREEPVKSALIAAVAIAGAAAAYVAITRFMRGR